MKGRSHRTIGILGASVVACCMSTAAHAVTSSPNYLPDYEPNLLAGDYANGQNGSWAQGPINFGSTYPIVQNTYVTDGNLSSYANSVAFNPSADAALAIFATPAAGFDYDTGVNSIGTTGNIGFVRIFAYLNASAVSGAAAFTDSYNITPTQIAIDYDYTPGSSALNNAYAINSGNFADGATILDINGVATGSSGGAVSLTGVDWLANGVVPGTVNPSYPQDGLYYVDLTVNIPSTNALYFDFGTSPNRSAGNGGILVNEIEAGTIVPEPTSMGLLLGGGMMLLRRRQRLA